jgi:hypothetical protein
MGTAGTFGRHREVKFVCKSNCLNCQKHNSQAKLAALFGKYTQFSSIGLQNEILLLAARIMPASYRQHRKVEQDLTIKMTQPGLMIILPTWRLIGR